MNDRRMIVVGEASARRVVRGAVERLAPDHPSPVLDETHDELHLDGAAEQAVRSARTGRQVTLICALADDEVGRRIAADLRRAGVTVLAAPRESPTPHVLTLATDTRPLVTVEMPGGPRIGPVPLPAARGDEPDGPEIAVVDGGGVVTGDAALAGWLASHGHAQG